MTISIEILGFILTVLTTAVLIGIAWGKLTSKINLLKVECETKLNAAIELLRSEIKSNQEMRLFQMESLSKRMDDVKTREDQRDSRCSRETEILAAVKDENSKGIKELTAIVESLKLEIGKLSEKVIALTKSVEELKEEK